MNHKIITSKTNDNELCLKIADEQSLNAFLNEEFQRIDRNIIDSNKSFNPLSMLKLNIKLASEDFDYTLFGLPITSIFGYADGNDIAIYLFLNISNQQLVKLIDEWDEPLMFAGDYHKMDNTVWKKEKLTISLIPNPIGNSNIGRIIIITNMGMKRIAKSSL